MKKIIILITLVLCMAAAFGQEKKLVVPPFDIVQGNIRAVNSYE